MIKIRLRWPFSRLCISNLAVLFLTPCFTELYRRSKAGRLGVSEELAASEPEFTLATRSYRDPY